MKRGAVVAALAAVLPSRVALAQTPAPLTMRLSGTGADDAAPVLYAMRAGIFRNAGLDVTFDRANSGAVTAAAVVGGAVDLGKSSLVSLISAHAHGVGIKLVAAGSVYINTSPDVELVVASDSPIRTARDLTGKTISVPALGDLNTVAAKSWIDAQGGDSRTVQFVEVPASAAAAAMEQGRVGAATLVRPYLLRALASGKVRVLANMFAAIAGRFLETGWFTTADYAGKHRDAVARFAKIVGDASAYANAHLDETAEGLAAFSGVDVAAIVEAGRGVYGTSLEARDIQPLIDAAAKYKVIERRFAATELFLR